MAGRRKGRVGGGCCDVTIHTPPVMAGNGSMLKPFLAAAMTLAMKAQEEVERLWHVSIMPASNANARAPASLRAPMLAARDHPMMQGLFGGVICQRHYGSATWRTMTSQSSRNSCASGRYLRRSGSTALFLIRNGVRRLLAARLSRFRLRKTLLRTTVAWPRRQSQFSTATTIVRFARSAA